MSNPVLSSIATQLDQIKKKILTFNKKSDLFGLFSYHILSELKDFGLEWAVVCNDKKWLEDSFKKDNLYDISKLGYSIHLNEKGSSKAITSFMKSLEILQKRNHFDGSHVTFPYQPITFLGLVLGTKHIEDTKQKEDYIDWLLSTLKERRKRGNISSFHYIFYKYIEAELENKKVSIAIPNNSLSLEELSFIDWGIRKGYFIISDPKNYFDKMEQQILTFLIRADINQIEPEQAPLIWSAVNSSLSGGISKLVKSPNHLINILLKFESAMKRWRYDDESARNPIKWPIENEKEIQDILWLMLKPFFDDLVDEQFLPKLGHSSYKPDFALPSLRILLEVKFVKKRGDFKKIEKEIMEDSVGYLTKTKDYDKIIVFIYDNSCSVQEHDETRRDLIKINGIEDVIIVSKPSQLPQ